MNTTQHELLKQLEDTLDLRCFCEAQPKLSTYCPIHGSDDALLNALKEHREATTTEISEACDAREKDIREEYEDDLAELKAARVTIDKLETQIRHIQGVLSDSVSVLDDVSALVVRGDGAKTKLLLTDVIQDLVKLQED